MILGQKTKIKCFSLNTVFENIHLIHYHELNIALLSTSWQFVGSIPDLFVPLCPDSVVWPSQKPSTCSCSSIRRWWWCLRDPPPKTTSCWRTMMRSSSRFEIQATVVVVCYTVVDNCSPWCRVCCWFNSCSKSLLQVMSQSRLKR